MLLEDGWPECDLSDCDYATIPGTPLRLPIQRGFPFIIMQAFLRDLDNFIEPVMNARGIADEGSWTQDNSVYTSNHKGATAVDYNWEDHPMGRAGAGWNGSTLIAGDQVPAVNALLSWFEGMIFWGNNWNSPKDSMHFQLGYNTYGAENAARVQNFIDRKIRADGYSTYRRGGTARGGGVTPPVAVPITSGLTGLVLQQIWDSDNVSLARYEQLVVPLIKAFHYADVTTIDRRAMALAQLGTESGGGQYQTEIASGAAYEGRCKDLGNCQPGDGVRFKGRDFLQITGRAHYLALSQWAFSTGVPGVTSPTFFVDNPEQLATDFFAFLGFAWYWKISRPQLNALADARDIVGATKAVNGGTNGLDSRKAYYAKALAANADLLDPSDDDDDEEDGVLQTSRSIYRTSNDATMSGSDASRGADATSHMNWVEQSAIRGEGWALALIKATALGGVGATKWWEVNAGNANPGIDPWAVGKATSVLNYIAANNPAALTPGGTK